LLSGARRGARPPDAIRIREAEQLSAVTVPPQPGANERRAPGEEWLGGQPEARLVQLAGELGKAQDEAEVRAILGRRS